MFRLGRYLKQDIHIQTLFRSLSCTEYTRKIHLTESPSFWWKRRWSLTIGVPKVAKLLFCISKTINYNWQWLLILKIIDEIVDCITYKNQLVEYLTYGYWCNRLIVLICLCQFGNLCQSLVKYSNKVVSENPTLNHWVNVHS